MKMHKLLVAAVIEGDTEAEKLVEELLGDIRFVDLTDEQSSRLADIHFRFGDKLL